MMSKEVADKMLIIQTVLPRQQKQQLKQQQQQLQQGYATRNGCVLNISFLFFSFPFSFLVVAKKKLLEKLLRFPLRQVGFHF